MPSSSRKLAYAFAIGLTLLGLLELSPLFKDAGGRLFGVSQLDSYKGAAHLAAAFWAFVSARMGDRASNLFLVACGLLFVIDGFTGLTRGVFYLDLGAAFEGWRVTPESERFFAALPDLIIGALALMSGLAFANRQAAREDRSDEIPN